MRILLDPGHGGIQLGAVVDGVQEKDLTLDLALRIAAALEPTPLGGKVFLTRGADYDVSHRERQRMAQTCNASVSLHFHATGNPFFTRLEGGARLAEGEALARLLLTNVSLALCEPFVFRPVQARFCAGMRRAVCILNLGHLSHPATLKGLVSGDRLDVMAQAIAQGLVASQTSRQVA